MEKVTFYFNEKETSIKCNQNENLKEICKRYCNEIGKDIDNLLFIYGTEEINDKLNFIQIANEEDRKRKEIKISVEEIKKEESEENSIELREIICPKCKEGMRMEIKDYKINIYDCKNGHKKSNILFKDFEKSQKIDKSKFICNICYKNVMSDINKLYRCCTCQNNLCLLCRVNHDNTHKIINYYDKNFLCNIHGEIYNQYCNDCKMDLCNSCKAEHMDDDVIVFKEKCSNSPNIKKNQIKLNNSIEQLNNFIKELIKKLINVMENMEAYSLISNDLMNSFQIKNYKMFKNILEIQNFNNIIINDINKIIKDDNITNKINYLLDINNKLSNKMDKDKYKNYLKKIDNKFEKNPNLKYKTDLIYNNDSHGDYDIFEAYTLYKDNKDYIASPHEKTHNLDIYSLVDNKRILSLKGHQKYIISVRYFFNDKDFNEYLISADHNKIVFIWDITNNYNIKYQIYTKYKKDVSGCLLVFPHNEDNYIVTSCDHQSNNLVEKSSTKIFSLNNGNYVRYINGSNKIYVSYLLSWHNKKNDKYYILQFSYNNIIINNLLEDEIYAEINPGGSHGCIYTGNKNDYLFYIYYSKIHIYDLNRNIEFSKIDFKNKIDIYIRDTIIPWNNKYIIVFSGERLVIYDMNNDRIISTIKANNLNGVGFVKKFHHPIYGEALLMADKDKNIKLWGI